MAFDSLTPYLIGLAAGLLLGILIRHILASRAAVNTEKDWLEKMRKANRDADALRNDLKTLTERADRANEAEADAKQKLAAAIQDAADARRDTANEPAAAVTNQDRGRIQELHAKVRDREDRIAKLTSEISRLNQSNEAANAKLKALSSRLSELEPLVNKFAAATEAKRNLENRLRAFEVAKTLELGNLHTRLSDLKDQEERQDQTVQSLKHSEAEVDKLRSKVAKLEAQTAGAAEIRERAARESAERQAIWDQRFRAVVEEKDSTILDLLRQRPASNGLPPAPPASPTPDDLKEIPGIGPVLEVKLKEIGVTSYRQIAGWTADDIRIFEAKLPQFRKRVERDNWIAGAREAHFRKYGERL